MRDLTMLSIRTNLLTRVSVLKVQSLNNFLTLSHKYLPISIMGKSPIFKQHFIISLKGSEN